MILKKLDTYIIKKFLGTFFLSILLILSITVMIDLTEKMDKFFDNHAPLKAVVFDYYLNLIPYFGNMLSPLFTFIAVIFFTSKMANNTEIVAIQSSGVSYNRLLRPYFISAAIIAIATFFLSGFVIPSSNKTRLDFENQYIKKFRHENVSNVQLEIEKGVILYIERFDNVSNNGYNVSMDKFEDKKLMSRITAEKIHWDTLNHWRMDNYLIREFKGMKETLRRGISIDTTIAIQPYEFYITAMDSPQMKNNELWNYLQRQRERGVGNIQAFEDEYHKRFSMPFAAFILTLIGVSLASRKVRGGTGLHLGIGLFLSFTYISFSTFSTSFSVNGSMSPILAAWLPNIIFSLIAFYLYTKAPK